MSLLREIQEAAVDAGTPISDVDLPAYRHVDGLTSIGSFAGPMGRAIRNVPLPMSPLPPELREKYMTAELRQGVARLEDLAHARVEDDLVLRWSPDLIAQLASKYYQGYSLIDAYVEMPRNAFVGALDSVRNSIPLKQAVPASTASRLLRLVAHREPPLRRLGRRFFFMNVSYAARFCSRRAAF